MPERVFLVHGWSVDSTTTYAALHHQLDKFSPIGQHREKTFELEEIYLGQYVSLDDDVEVRDLSRGMDSALTDRLRNGWDTPFHIITHSTGALVVRHWLTHHYVDQKVSQKPLTNVIFLAGPQFGSRLAHHGRSMVAEAFKGGPTGDRILNALELGSEFSWQAADEWLDQTNWEDKGVLLYCLTGDRVPRGLKDRVAAKILPAHYEDGSDQVIRVPAGNLNFRRYVIDFASSRRPPLREVKGIAFGSLWRYLHSGDRHGILGSIGKRTSPAAHQALRLILECLQVDRDKRRGRQSYGRMRRLLTDATTETTTKRRGPFAQLDFRFRDHEGHPVDDYKIVIGYLDAQGEGRPSDSIAHTHKNKVDPNHFTVLVDLSKLEQDVSFYMEFSADAGTPLLGYVAGRKVFPGNQVRGVLRANETTQIDVIVGRLSEDPLFRFFKGDDSRLPVKWDRTGQIEPDR